MTAKKKRGLLSWLGFADEEKQQSTTDTPIDSEAQDSDQQDLASQDSEQSQEQALSESEQQTVDNDDIQAEIAEPEKTTESEEVEVETVSVESSLNDDETDGQVADEPQTEAEELKADRIQEQTKPMESFFVRLKRSLQRTKQNIGAGFFGLFKNKKIDDELFEELEEQLLIADVGMNTTVKIIDSLTEKASKQDLKDGEALYGLLKQEMTEILSDVEQPLQIDTTKTPYVILMVGVNGVGKTTTIGKLAKQFQSQGKSVILAAGDTFRAAAVEQLQVWGQRNDVPVIAQHTGADSASVIYDAIEAAKARGVDVVIADTAGRLQNKSNLMEELRKIVRVMKKIDDSAPHEVMLTLDAGTGQNAISQAQLFSDVAPVTGINLTKLDGTAKGGVIFALADQFKIPIRYIGVGEGIDDLRPFEAQDFIEALFSRDE